MPHHSVEAVCIKHKSPAYLQLLAELEEAQAGISSVFKEAIPGPEVGMVTLFVVGSIGSSPVVGQSANILVGEVSTDADDPITAGAVLALSSGQDFQNILYGDGIGSVLDQVI